MAQLRGIVSCGHCWHLSTAHRLLYFVPDPSLNYVLCENPSLWLEDCVDVQPPELMHCLSLRLDQLRALQIVLALQLAVRMCGMGGGNRFLVI